MVLPRLFQRVSTLSLALLFSASVLLAEAPKAESLQAGWTRFDKKADHFSLALPPTWRQIDMDPAKLDESLAKLSEVNPAMGAALTPQIQSLVASGVKFFGLDPDVELAKTGFATNLSAIVDKIGPKVDFEASLRANVAQIEAVDVVVKPVQQTRLKIGGRDAARLRYEMVLNPEAEFKVVTTQYLFVAGGHSIIFTFSNLPTQTAHYEPTFAAIAQTIRIFD